MGTLKSPPKGRCVCRGGCRKINCVCDLNESLNSEKGEVGVRWGGCGEG